MKCNNCKICHNNPDGICPECGSSIYTMEYDYKSIVYEKKNPSNKKEMLYKEKINGKTYGYDALKATYNQMNKDYPDFMRITEKL